jgi:hypothetical protein
MSGSVRRQMRERGSLGQCRGNTQSFIFIYVPLYSCDHMISTTASSFGLKKSKKTLLRLSCWARLFNM